MSLPLSIVLIVGTLTPLGNASTAVADNATVSTPMVKVEARKLVAALPYRHHLEIQHQLHGYLPPDPELVDLWFRIGYWHIPESDRAALALIEQAIAIESPSVQTAVPMRRSAYLSLLRSRPPMMKAPNS